MIEREDHHGVAVLRMTHGKVNAIDLDLLNALSDAVDSLGSEHSSALVLTGSGGNFSAGLNLVRLVEGDASYISDLLAALDRALLSLFTLPCPVIAAVNGHAIAGGFVLACACDARVVTDGRAKFGVTELPVGVPFPSAPLELVRTVFGSRRTRELVYSGRLISAAEGVEMGFSDGLTPNDNVLDRAIELAAKWGRAPSRAFAATKQQLQEPTVTRIRAHQERFSDEIEAIWKASETLDAIRAFIQKTLR